MAESSQTVFQAYRALVSELASQHDAGYSIAPSDLSELTLDDMATIVAHDASLDGATIQSVRLYVTNDVNELLLGWGDDDTTERDLDNTDRARDMNAVVAL